MQQTQHVIEKVVLDNSNDASGLSVQMIDLQVVQKAVGNLMNRIDEITENRWHEDCGMAYLSIQEIQDTVRLIDMAFYPLFKRMEDEVKNINTNADKLYELIKSDSKQFSTTIPKLDINSLEGWNCYAMEGNIKTFIKEFGREPESFEEVLTYITETVERVVNKKADALTSTEEIKVN